MTISDFRFLLDLMITSQEKSFIADLMRNPEDRSTRNAYVDYLKENGRETSADMVKEGYIPGYRLRSHEESSWTTYGVSSGFISHDVPIIFRHGIRS